MSETWHQHKIGDLFDYTIPGEWGGEPKLNREVPVIRSTNFTNDGKLDLSRIVLRDVPASRLEKRTVERGDILFEKSGGGPSQPAGRVAYCGGDFCGTCSNFIEIAKVKKKFDSEFVAFLLHSLYKEGLILKYQQQTTGIINFKLNEYKQEIVKVPDDKAQQSKIAQVLSTLDRAIAQSESLLVKQHRVKAGLMQEFLGIKSAGHSSRISMSLASIAEINPARGSLPSVDKASFITMADVSESARWLNRQTRRITEVKSGYTFFREGDILLAKITPCLENGKGCHAIGLENRIGFGSTEFHVIRARDNADARFIFQLTKFNHFRQQAATKMTGSAGQQRVPAQFLENYPVRELNKNEQVKIGYVLDAADNAMEVTGNQIAKLQSLKAGLMQDLLTGRVSVLPLMGDSV